jgi:hypothetical protein
MASPFTCIHAVTPSSTAISLLSMVPSGRPGTLRMKVPFLLTVSMSQRTTVAGGR